MFIKVTKGKNKEYVYVVRGYRDARGKTKHEIVHNFGPVTPKTKDSVIKSAQRMIDSYDGNEHNTNPIDLTSIQELERRNWGCSAVIDALSKTFKLPDLFENLTNRRKIKFNLNHNLSLLLSSKFTAPRSKLGTYLQREKFIGFDDIKLQDIYKTLDELNFYQENIKEHIFKQQLALGEDLKLVFLDVTTLYFESQKIDDLRNFGYSKDCKFNEVQIVLTLLVNDSGAPLSYQIFRGNISEGETLVPILNKFKDDYGVRDVTIVTDRGLSKMKNLEAITEAGFNYVVAYKFRAGGKKLQEEVLNKEGYEILSDNEEDKICYKKIEHRGLNLLAMHSDKRASKDKLDRERLIEKASLMVSNKSYKSKRGAQKYLSVTSIDASLDEEKIKEEARFDGFYVTCYSDKELEPGLVASSYKGLWRIEESFRIAKSFFEIRPMFHWTEKRIEGHILLNFIALVMERYIEKELKRRDKAMSPNDIREALSNMQVSVLKFEDKKLLSYSKLCESEKAILQAMKILEPKNKLML